MFYCIVFVAVSIVFRIVFNFKVQGREYLTAYKTNGRPFVVCGNHLSMIDPVFVVMAYGVGKKMSIMGKAELFKNPIAAWFMTHMQTFPVHRGKGDTSAIEYGEKIIQEGHVMAICPEGKRIRGKGGRPQRAKAGVAIIAKATNAGVLPVAICCDGEIKAGKKVTVSYGKLITPEDMNFDKEDFGRSDISNAANMVMDRITELWEAEQK